MANPSLQIGNGKWAIKEDSLLGYTELGNNIAPVEIDMTRASAGTRVNPQGLVETVELLGSEDVVNGDFATDSSWIKGTGWTIAGGNATLAVQASISSLASNTMSVTVGKVYKITINVSATASGFRLYDSLGVVSYGLPLGESVFYRTPSSSIYTVTPLGLAGSSGVIDNISVKEYAVNNLARVNYTGSTSSLLAEPMRTNLITYSSDFSNAAWLSGGQGKPTIASNNYISPDGTINADKLTTATSSINYQLRQNIAVINTSMTISVYLKAELADVYVKLYLNDTEHETTVTVTSEWQRFELSGLIGGSLLGSGRCGFSTQSDLSGSNFMYMWGAQLEEGSYSTSLIPTSGSTVTRVQDTFTKTGISDKINSEEGVLFLEASALEELSSGNRHISISNGSTSNRLYFYYTQSGRFGFASFVGGVLQGFINYNGVILNNSKIACKWKLNDYSLWVNGVEVGTDTSASVWSADTLNQFAFADPNAGSSFYGKVKQLQVFKTALTDSELATLTT